MVLGGALKDRRDVSKNYGLQSMGGRRPNIPLEFGEKIAGVKGEKERNGRPHNPDKNLTKRSLS